jgi:hypothetical protein
MPFEPPHFIRSWTELRNNLGTILGSLFLFYVIAASGYVNDAFGCGLNNFIKSHHWARHIIGILTIFLFTNIFTITNLHIIPKLCFAIGLYMVYWFSNKNIATAQIVLILFAVGVYFMQLVRSDNDLRLSGDPDLTEADRAVIQKDNDQLARGQTALLGIGLLLLLVGHLIYVGKKRLEYGMQFSWCELIKGQYPCRGTDRRVYSIYECLAALKKPLKQIVKEEQILNSKLSEKLIKAEINFTQSKETFTRIFSDGSDKEWVNYNVPSGVSFSTVTDEALIGQYFEINKTTTGGYDYRAKLEKTGSLTPFNASGYMTGKDEPISRENPFKNIDKHTIQGLYKAITGRAASTDILENYQFGFQESINEARVKIANTLSQLSAQSANPAVVDGTSFNNPLFNYPSVAVIPNLSPVKDSSPLISQTRSIPRFPNPNSLAAQSEQSYLLQGSPPGSSFS